MTATNTIAYIRSLFPAWLPEESEIGLYAKRLNTFHQDDAREAVDRHKASSKYGIPNLATILEAARELNRERVERETPREEPHAYESRSQWIERTIASATPEELAELERRIPMAMHMPGLIAAGIEKFRRGRRAAAR